MKLRARHVISGLLLAAAGPLAAVDFAAERDKRIHDLNDKRLNEMRQVFEQAMPLTRGKSKSKPKKKR